MSVAIHHLKLNIDSPLVTPSAPNYQPTSWPPADDFPVVINKHAVVVSRYGDEVWTLSPWAKTQVRLSFQFCRRRSDGAFISSENAALLKQIAAWWLWGPGPLKRTTTIQQNVRILRSIFVLCSKEGISVTKLSEYPAIAAKIPECISKNSRRHVVRLLHGLLEGADQHGIIVLDKAGLKRLSGSLEPRDSRQTPYIPPRIWLYQVTQLRAFLDDFLANKEKIEACHQFCLDAYAGNYGSLSEACAKNRQQFRAPFNNPSANKRKHSTGRYYGPFSQTAEIFAIDMLLERWCERPKSSPTGVSITTFTAYCSLATYVAMAYVMNFSLMRRIEAWSLRSDCLLIEHDESFGPIYLLRGETTKTIRDGDAWWVASPSVKIAIEVASCVARLRMAAALARPEITSTAEEMEHPNLAALHHEPWAKSQESYRDSSVLPTLASYSLVVRQFPKLFDRRALQITPDDLQFARLITPSLNSEKFAVGLVWPLAWHQLRRTGAVNMLASGLVSCASVQYQLKHATRAMALYYGQGHSKVVLNRSAHTEYIKTIYEFLGQEVERLLESRYVSPYGESRKAEILKLVTTKDSEALAVAAKTGKVAWRTTLLGGCTKRGPCEYGGVDNVVRCGGGDGLAPCADALYDRDRTTAIGELHAVISERLNASPNGSPYQESLKAQLRAVENVINVIK